MFVLNSNIYNMTLISKVKERTGPKNLKKITQNLKNLENVDNKVFPGLKLKKFEEKKEEKFESENADPIIELSHYNIEDFKNFNSRSILNDNDEYDGENISEAIGYNEEVK